MDITEFFVICGLAPHFPLKYGLSAQTMLETSSNLLVYNSIEVSDLHILKGTVQQ
jgi:hypothetical protein